MGIILPELLSASPWQRVSFTTYALSLSFFEAVPLDLLTRAGAQNVTILADVEGVRAALGEQGARRVGKDYQVEPILVDGGVFHPKISILATAEDCHLLISSGNLTFGGWGNNLEVLEHLHPSFAANVFAGAGDFFQHLASEGRIKHRAKSTFEAIARDLGRASATGKPNSNLQFLHNLATPIADQIGQAAEELGGATRITAGAPYWTKGAAEGLCRRLGQDRLYVHCHEGGSVRSTFGSNWPTGAAVSLVSGRMEPLTEKGKQRLLHAKLVEVVCRKGRLIFSGSANITAAALTQARNIEACLLRIDRVRKKGWGWEAAPAPDAQPALESDALDGESVGVLRATLANNRMHVTVLVPKMTGKVAVSRSTVDGRVDLGSATADAESSFVIGAADLEYLSWKDERLVLRVEQGVKAAEGFIAVTSYSDVRRRMGSIAGQIFAVLSGSETPSDIAAMFSWFHEHPEVLDAAPSGARGDSDADTEDSTAVVRVSELTDIVDLTADIDGGRRQDGDHAWQRIMQSLLNAFRIKRTAAPEDIGGETPDGDDGEETPEPGAETEDDGEIERFLAFERLLALLLAPGQPLSRAIVAFDLTQYVCLQLNPESRQALAWIGGIFRALIERGGVGERHAELAATVLLLHHRFPESGENDRDARLRLLRLGVSLESDAPAFESIPGFVNLFGAVGDWAATWRRLKQIKCLQEQVRAYRDALRSGTPSPLEYPDLPKAAPVAWATLQEAVVNPEFRGEIITVTRPFSACPRCHRALPVQDVLALEACGIGLARDCCGKVLICEEV